MMADTHKAVQSPRFGLSAMSGKVTIRVCAPSRSALSALPFPIAPTYIGS